MRRTILRLYTSARQVWKSRIEANIPATFRLLQIRLRIPLALLLAALVVGRWDELRNRWEKLTRLVTTGDATMSPVSNDTEYFCPMDPGVVSEWPSRCGVCHMALVARKKGEASMLPDGVIARMQLSLYRVQLAGILTARADYLPLKQSLQLVGTVTRKHNQAFVHCEVPSRRAPWLSTGARVEARSQDLPGLGPWPASVTKLTSVIVAGREILQLEVLVKDDAERLRPGMSADLTFQIPAALLEPFQSQPSDPPPLRNDEPTQVFICTDHADSISLTASRCPEDHLPRVAYNLEDRQRLRWWCPMHPAVTSDRPGATCSACAGMPLKAKIVRFRPTGQVLAIPASAVIDTGTKTVVFVESMVNMFDGVEVVLGPRCDDFYPVVQGLEAGQQIVINGAFLLDAETRLNPGLAAGYFGAVRRRAESTPEAQPGQKEPASPTEDKAILSELASLSPADRELARRQGTCPVTRKPLGSMGPPVRVDLTDQSIFICCSGCEAALRRDPTRYQTGKTAGQQKP